MITWLLLAALAYVLVTCVLGMLAMHVKNERQRHDLIVDARRRRQAYLAKLKDDPDEDLELV